MKITFCTSLAQHDIPRSSLISLPGVPSESFMKSDKEAKDFRRWFTSLSIVFTLAYPTCWQTLWALESGSIKPKCNFMLSMFSLFGRISFKSPQLLSQCQLFLLGDTSSSSIDLAILSVFEQFFDILDKHSDLVTAPIITIQVSCKILPNAP